MTKTVLITGIAGMLGSHIAEYCLAQGFDVSGIDNLTAGRTEYVPEGVAFFQADVRDHDVQGSHPYQRYDLVIHAAAEPFIPKCYLAPKEFVSCNVLGTLNLLQSLPPDTGRVVVISSSEVYGTADNNAPMTEDHPLRPASTYAATKLAQEAIARTYGIEHGLPVIIFRPFNCFGPRSCQPYLIPELIRQIHAWKRDGTDELQIGNLAAKRDFTPAKIMANAIVNVGLHGVTGETYHYGSGIARSVVAIVNDVATACGHDKTKIDLGCLRIDKGRLRPNDVQHLQADNKKISNNDILRPALENDGADWLEGIAAMVAWYEANGCKWAWEK